MEEREYGYISPRARVGLVLGYTLAGMVLGWFVLPAEWGVIAQIGMGGVGGMGSVLCVYVARFLY